MKRFKLIIMVMFVCLLAAPTFAQDKREFKNKCNRGEKVDKNLVRQKMMKQKYEYFQKGLQLDDEQMKKFWEVYEHFDNEIFECHEQLEKKSTEILKGQDMFDKDFEELKLDDSQAQELLEIQKEREHRLIEIKDNFGEKLMSVISPQQILKLHKLEKEVVKQVMRTGRCDIDGQSHDTKDCHKNSKRDNKKK